MMTPGEIFVLKRENFIVKTLKYFQFLVDEFGYENPIHKFWQQENGSITRDQFSYDHIQTDKSIVLSNSYHPNDYGFEINLSKPKSREDGGKMIHYILKENQNVEQTYLENAAEILRINLQAAKME